MANPLAKSGICRLRHRPGNFKGEKSGLGEIVALIANQ